MPLSNFVPRGFGFVHHSIAILYHEVPNPNLTIRNLLIAAGAADGARGCDAAVDHGPRAGGDVAVSASTRFQLQVTTGFNPIETLTPTHG